MKPAGYQNDDKGGGAAATQAGRLGRLGADRTARALVLGAVIIAGYGSLRPDKSEGLYPMEYWARKVAWRDCADVVLTGDSRVIMGVSPAVMEELLPGRAIYNYGFGANGYAQRYLEATLGVLKEDSDCKTVILGMTPLTLSTAAVRQNVFIDECGKSASHKFLAREIPGILNFFEPLPFKDVKKKVFPDKKRYARSGYYRDGWVWRVRRPEDPRAHLDTYHKHFLQDPVNEEIVERVLRFTRECRQEGIAVYGFRPPSHELMLELEDELSGWVEADFPRRFAAAGGIWIETDQTKYPSFDGSHLRRDGAEELSRDLARVIRQHEIAAGRMSEVEAVRDEVRPSGGSPAL